MVYIFYPEVVKSVFNLLKHWRTFYKFNLIWTYNLNFSQSEIIAILSIVFQRVFLHGRPFCCNTMLSLSIYVPWMISGPFLRVFSTGHFVLSIFIPLRHICEWERNWTKVFNQPEPFIRFFPHCPVLHPILQHRLIYRCTSLKKFFLSSTYYHTFLPSYVAYLYRNI